MRWRDIRFEKPTEADGDKRGEIVQLLNNGRVCTADLNSMAFMVAWMPLSELPAFDRIPDPPEGWRFVQADEAFDQRAMFWADDEWEVTGNKPSTGYDPDFTYIVPIDPPPPEPQYRPFADAAEFEQWATLLFWRYKQDSDSTRRPPSSYSDDHHHGDKWDYSLANKVFADGSPFGVRVEQ